MFTTILGLILILIPFVLVFYFKDRMLGFLYVFTGATAWHLISAMILQSLGIFSYQAVLAIYITTAAGAVLYAWLKRRQAAFNIKINWLLLATFTIIIFELLSVHYFYTGTITDFLGDRKVIGASYPYPYFADDWAGVAFTNYTIKTGSLPIIHPLIGDNKFDFPNIFIAFFAGLAEVFLILDIPPLTGYAAITVVTGTLICWLAFLFLRAIKVEHLPAAIAALSLPWIINSAKLPGIWYLFPFIGGTIFFLVSLTALNLRAKILALISGFVSLLLYPPLVVFIVPTLLIAALEKNKQTIKTRLMLLGLILITGLATLLVIALQKDNWPVLYEFFLRSLIRMNNEGCIPIRRLWEVVPWPLLPLILLGIIEAGRRKLNYFLVPLIIGLIYWLTYSFSPKYLIIDYARIAAFTSYLLVIAAGLGAAAVLEKLKNKYPARKRKKNLFIIELLIISLFALLSLFYTQREAWKKIILRYDNGWEAPIISPAHQYLHPDDLRIFQNLSQQRFIAPPWKGLVIGAATGNYPLHNKASIIYNEVIRYDMFFEANCFHKTNSAEDLGIDYAYLPPISCPRFEYIDSSQEGLNLYKFKK